MYTVAVIPARGGSKGLPGKNLAKVQGRSLVERAILVAKNVKAIKRIIVSTDDEEIAEHARQVGAEVPYLRPPELSKDDTPMVAVLSHIRSWLRSDNNDGRQSIDAIILLAPTSPMRRSEEVAGAIDLYFSLRNKYIQIGAVHTVSPVPACYQPQYFWKAVTRENGIPVMNRNKTYGVNRQYYYRNGAAVVLDPNRIEALNIKRWQVYPFIIDRPLVSIDSEFDRLRVEHSGSLEPDTAANLSRPSA